MQIVSQSNPNNEALIRGYEHKVLSLDSELKAERCFSEELKSKYEKVVNDYKQLQTLFSQRAKMVSNLRQITSSTCTKKQELEKSLKQSQIHRKSLYDHQFTVPRAQFGKYWEGSIDLMDQIHSVKLSNYEKIITQLEDVINRQNDEILSSNKQTAKLSKQLLKVTSQYEHKNYLLTMQNTNLKEQCKKVNQLQTKLQELRIREGQSMNTMDLSLQNKNLKQKLKVAVTKINEDQQKIYQLRRQLATLSRTPSHPNQPKINSQVQSIINNYQYSEVRKLVLQKERLSQQLTEISEKYVQLVQRFPEYMDNEDWIQSIMDKAKKLSKLEIDNQIANQQITTLKHKIQQTNQHFSTRLNTLMEGFKKREQEANVKLKIQENTIEKFNQFFGKIQQYFTNNGCSQYELLRLSDKEEEEIRNAVTQKVNHNLTEFENQFSLAVENSIKNQELSQQTKGLRIVIEKAQDKIIALEATIEAMTKKAAAEQNNIKEDKYGALISDFAKLQQERNLHQLMVKERQMDNLDLYLKNIKLSLKQNNEDNHQNQSKPDEHCETPITCPKINIVSCFTALKDSNQQIDELKRQLSALHDTFKDEKQELVACHSNQVIKLNKTIQQLKSIQSQQKEASQQSQQMQKENQIGFEMHPKLSKEIISHHEIDMDDQEINQEFQIPINTLTAQSIQNLSQLLSGHETILGNVLSAFKQLYRRLLSLEKQKAEMQQIKQNQQAKQKKLLECLNELTIMKKRLEENDNNITILEQRIWAKDAQLSSCKSNHQEEMKLLQQKYNQLLVQKQQLQNFMESNKQKQVYDEFQNSLGSSGEQIQYLVSLLGHWKQKVDQLTQQLAKTRTEKLSNQQHPQNQQLYSHQMLDQQRRCINMICDSDVNTMLQKVIQIFSQKRT